MAHALHDVGSRELLRAGHGGQRVLRGIEQGRSVVQIPTRLQPQRSLRVRERCVHARIIKLTCSSRMFVCALPLAHPGLLQCHLQ